MFDFRVIFIISFCLAVNFAVPVFSITVIFAPIFLFVWTKPLKVKLVFKKLLICQQEER